MKSFCFLVILVFLIHSSSCGPTPLSGAKTPVLVWIEQRLDHFNETSYRTWFQRYYENDQFYIPGGPIFIMVSLPGTADPDWLRGGQMVEYGLYYGSKLVLMEQRYYGESRPTENTSVENMQAYFTPEQTIGDLVYLIEKITYSHPRSKVVVFGGSFSGNIAAWARLQHPDVIHAAVVASAPLLARYNFVQYMEEVGRMMALADQQCYDDMRTAITDLNVILAAPGGAQTVTQMFGLCADLNPKYNMDMMAFQTTFSNIYAGVVQGASSIEVVKNNCNLMTSAVYGATPLDRLVDLFQRVFRPDPAVCFDIRYQPYLQEYRNESWDHQYNTVGKRQFTYQTCSQFADFETSDSPNQPFGKAFSVDDFVQLCMDIYGDSFNAEFIQAAVKRTNDKFGGLWPNVTNVVFTQGSFDPWRDLGVQEDLSELATAIVIEESSQIQFLYASNAFDSPQMAAARKEVRDLIGVWVQSPRHMPSALAI